MSIFEPYNWNVVVNAAWNRAILTPGGIARRLFCLDQGEGVQVLVPLEGLAPPKVSHNGITVTVSSSHLIVEPSPQDFDGMEKAMAVACAALKALPETPFSAAGYNIRYKVPFRASKLTDTIESSAHGISDSQYKVLSSGRTHQIEHNSGVLNFRAETLGNGKLNIEFNFHLDSNRLADLVEWLSVKKDDVKKYVSGFLSELGIDLEEEHV